MSVKNGVQGRTRDEWASPLEFLMTAISLSVGFGNVWRFPFVAFQNGGGAFLIPYITVLFFIGKPIYYMELIVGQFSSYGPVKIWKMAPIFKGVGYGELIASICGNSYYCSIMAVTIYYLIASFSSVLPWTLCNPLWTDVCPQENHTSVDESSVPPYSNSETLPELYYERSVTKQKNQIDDGLGPPDLSLAFCLLASWTLVFITLVKGIHSSGKFAYFFAIFPYIVLFTLLIRGLTLPGAYEGVMYFILPDWSKIFDIKVWFAAIIQCFFSLGCGFGPIIMNASYNSFRHNVYRDMMIITLMDTFTSLLAGFTIFSVLGNLAYEMQVDITSVAKSGPGLAFISYPQAVARFTTLPQLFAVLFFLMMLTLGMGSAVSVCNGIITVICDQFPQFKRILVTLTVTVAGFFLGLIYITPGGGFMVTLVDYYGASLMLIICALLEVIGIMFIYGMSNFCRDVEFMLNIKVSLYWKICWVVVVPPTLLVALVYTLITNKTLTHNGYEFPPVAIVCGTMLSIGALSVIPLCAVHTIFTRKSSSFVNKLKDALKPSTNWGPMNPSLKEEWRSWKKQEVPLSSFS